MNYFIPTGTITKDVPAMTKIDLTPPFDIGDAKVMFVQIDTIATTATAAADIEIRLQTTLDKDHYPYWGSVGLTYLAALNVGDSNLGRWELTGTSASNLLKWGKLTVANTTAVSIRVTLRLTTFVKECTT